MNITALQAFDEWQRAEDFEFPSHWTSEERQAHRVRCQELEAEWLAAAEADFWASVDEEANRA